MHATLGLRCPISKPRDAVWTVLEKLNLGKQIRRLGALIWLLHSGRRGFRVSRESDRILLSLSRRTCGVEGMASIARLYPDHPELQETLEPRGP